MNPAFLAPDLRLILPQALAQLGIQAITILDHDLVGSNNLLHIGLHWLLYNQFPAWGFAGGNPAPANARAAWEGRSAFDTRDWTPH